jgi:hypothetical protein
MSYVSLLKNIPEILGQPTGIAAIASLGIHGAIALIVPLMPVDSNKAKNSESSKAVGVMELSQADQERLPQTSPQPQLPVGSQFPLPSQVPLNLGDQPTALPSLPPPPASSQMVLPPPIPKSLDQYRVSSLPKGQSLQITPRGNFRFDTSGFNANRKFSQSVPSFNDRDIKLGEGKPLPVDKLPTLPGAKIPDGLPDSPGASSVEENSSAQTTQPGKDASEVAQNEQLIARIDKTPQAGDNLGLAKDSLPQWQPGSASKLPNELPTNTTEQAIAQVNSYEDLRKTVQQEYPNAEEKAVIRDTISTDKPELEGTILGGLVIDPDGKVLEIKFQDKSVSRDLLLKAREYFVANPPKGQKKTSYYPFRLQFQNKTSNNAGATKEPAPTPAALTKPFTNPVENSKQPAPTPAVTTKPFTNPVENSKQPAPTPAVTTKPFTNPVENSKQPAPTPAALTKPFTNPVENSKQPAPTPVIMEKPLSTADDNKNEPVTVVQPDKKLIQQLRELKKQTESSDQEK